MSEKLRFAPKQEDPIPHGRTIDDAERSEQNDTIFSIQADLRTVGDIIDKIDDGPSKDEFLQRLQDVAKLGDQKTGDALAAMQQQLNSLKEDLLPHWKTD